MDPTDIAKLLAWPNPELIVTVRKAVVKRGSLKANGDVELHYAYSVKNAGSVKIDHFFGDLSVCSAQNHVIGRINLGGGKISPGEEIEFESELTIHTAGTALDEALSNASIYVSVNGVVEHEVRFESTHLGKTPVSLHPINSVSGPFRVLQATALAVPDADNPKRGAVFLKIFVCNEKSGPLSHVVCEASIPTLGDSWRPRARSLTPIEAHAFFVITYGFTCSAKDFALAKRSTLEAKVSCQETVAHGGKHHVGIVIQDADQDDAVSDDPSNWKSSESLNKEEQLGDWSLADVLSDMKLVGMWEKSGDHHRCRYFWAWRDLGDGRIAGFFGGYSGGGSFAEERFFARLKGGKPVSFIYDYGDKVTQDEEANIDDVLDGEDEATRLAAGHGGALRWLWHDVEAMEEEQWRLDPAMEKYLHRSDDMLILNPQGDVDIVRKLAKFAPMNAAPK